MMRDGEMFMSARWPDSPKSEVDNWDTDEPLEIPRSMVWPSLWVTVHKHSNTDKTSLVIAVSMWILKSPRWRFSQIWGTAYLQILIKSSFVLGGLLWQWWGTQRHSEHDMRT